MDVLLIPSRAKNIKDAETFLRCTSRPENQSSLANSLGYCPASKSGTVLPGPMVEAEIDMLRHAAGVSRYFDRDTLSEFEKRAVPVLVEFVTNGDIDAAVTMLEQARLASFH